MTKITEISDRGATIAWSPLKDSPDLVALGAKDSGGVDFTDTGGELEIFDFGIQSDSLASQNDRLLGSVKTTSRFASVSWTNCASRNDRFSMGLLAGGMVDGSVHVWDPKAILNEKESMLTTFSNHASGPVKAMQFSPLNTTRLATGGMNGQVLIVDLDQPESPVVRKPCEDYKQDSEITGVAWNTQVEHIVASAAGDGSVAVWDLNSNKAWCELRCETSGQAVADVCWNPTQGLHLMTASMDDRNPILKLWDLRASTSMPLATLSGHTKGILKTSWCPHDETLFLSVGKDNRTILWDLYTLRPIADIPNDAHETVGHDQHSANSSDLFGPSGLASSQQRRYDIQWSPVNRGVAATCSLDRKVQAHSVISLATKSGRPPKWMKRSSSVSCGFGGAIVSVGSTDKFVRFRTVVEQPELVEASSDFESSIASSSVIDFCDRMTSKVTDSFEKQTWGFMKFVFEKNARKQLLGHLGFDAESIAKVAMEYSDESSNGNKISSQENQMTKGAETAIKEALLVGNFEAAVECCIRTGNLADALMLASCGGADLWSKTQERFFQSESAKRPFLTTVSAIIRNQMEELVANSDVENWQETLAILSTYAQAEKFPELCISLGECLEASGNHQNASLCYMCSLSLDHSVKFWRMKLEEANKIKGSLDLLALHEFVVKVTTFLRASGSSANLGDGIAELFSKYAKALSEQGSFVTAARYCRGSHNESKILSDRLYRSRSSQKCLHELGSAPEFPFSYDPQKSVSRSVQVATKTIENTRQEVEATSQAYHQSAQEQSAGVVQAPMDQNSTQLPVGWISLQDPSSGRTYYANQTTGETSWDMPQAVPTQQINSQVSYNSTSHMSNQASTVQENKTPFSPESSTNSRLASKYGDGFVTSASHPELAHQYGNVGTSNAYLGVSRPGTASLSKEKAPISKDIVDVNSLPLPAEFQPIKDGLMLVAASLAAARLTTVDKRQLDEANKGVTILVKKLSRGGVTEAVVHKVKAITDSLSVRDYATATSILTGLVSNDWRENKDWLKGVKSLIQLASKRLQQ